MKVKVIWLEMRRSTAGGQDGHNGPLAGDIATLTASRGGLPSPSCAEGKPPPSYHERGVVKEGLLKVGYDLSRVGAQLSRAGGRSQGAEPADPSEYHRGIGTAAMRPRPLGRLGRRCG